MNTLNLNKKKEALNKFKYATDLALIKSSISKIGYKYFPSIKLVKININILEKHQNICIYWKLLIFCTMYSIFNKFLFFCGSKFSGKIAGIYFLVVV